MPSKLTKIFYICAAVFLIGVFLAVLYQPVKAAFHEQDLWWMVPVMSYVTEGHSVPQNLKSFIFDPYPTLYGDSWMNTYLFFVLSAFGFQVKYFIFVSLVFHFLCALLLYSLLRELDLDFRVAFFSALVYLTMFIHFAYYAWPMSSHHLFVLFFSLLVLNLYFETTRRIDANRDWKPLFWLTILTNFLASFCQITILMLPVGILAHILISSKDGQERLKKYDIWLPLVITYLGYPLIRLIYVGSPHLEWFLHMGVIGSRSTMLFPVVFLLGVGVLFLFRGVLKLSCRYRMGRIFRNLSIASIVLYLLVFIAVYGRNDLVTPNSKVQLYVSLSPYNIIRPFVIMFINFISPVRSALAINSTVAYHVIPQQANIIAVLSSLLLIIVFTGKYFLKHKGLVIFLIFYIVALRWLRIPTTLLFSRHFLYITPLFSIVFCCSFIYIYDLIVNKIRLKKVAQEVILILVFIGLCVPNVFAVRLEMLRGRLVNTFLIYDYIRIADIIKHDTEAFRTGSRIKAGDIFIEGLRPMPFVEYDWPGVSNSRLKYGPFRYAFAQVFGDKSMVDVNINKPATPGKLVYRVNDFRVYDSKGSNVDRFSLYFDEAVKELRSGNNGNASALFEKAIGIKPFLLDYILSGYKLEDLGRITGGRDLRDWINDIVTYYNFGNTGHPVEKVAYVSSTVNYEIDDYIKCLFYEAYLDHLSGRPEESGGLLSRMRFIESDHGRLSSLLAKEPAVRSDRQMLDFLHNMNTTD